MNTTADDLRRENARLRARLLQIAHDVLALIEIHDEEDRRMRELMILAKAADVEFGPKTGH